jgi:hypothetical protein
MTNKIDLRDEAIDDSVTRLYDVELAEKCADRYHSYKVSNKSQEEKENECN